MNNISPRNESNALSVDSLPRDALESIIRRLNQKSARVQRIFDDNYKVEVTNLKNLVEKVDQELSGYRLFSKTVEISLYQSDAKRYDFQSWDDFNSFDTSSSSKTSSIEITLTYDILRDESSNPERYTTQVSVNNRVGSFGIAIGPDGMRPLKGSEIRAHPAPVFASVEFNNYIVGKNLMSTVSDWVEALPQLEDPVIIKLQKNSQNIRSLLSLLSTLAAIALCYWLVDFNILKVETLKEAVLALLAGAGIIQLIHKLGLWLGAYIERSIDKANISKSIVYTDGDRQEAEKEKATNTQLFVKATLGTIISILNIVGSFFANYWLELFIK